MGFNACTVVTISVCDTCQFQLLDEPCIVNLIHATAVFQNPVDKLSVRNIVNQPGNHQIVSVNGSTIANKVTLPVDVPKRNNRETSRRSSVKNCFPLNVVLPDNLRVCPLFFQYGNIFILALDVIRISVKFIQSSPKRLAIINLPETNTSFQPSVILVINRDELCQIETFKVVKIPETKSNAAVLRMSSDILYFLVKVLAKFCFVGFFFECHAIAQQIGNRLSGEVVIPV